jgi:hypothetical protein
LFWGSDNAYFHGFNCGSPSLPCQGRQKQGSADSRLSESLRLSPLPRPAVLGFDRRSRMSPKSGRLPC